MIRAITGDKIDDSVYSQVRWGGGEHFARVATL